MGGGAGVFPGTVTPSHKECEACVRSGIMQRGWSWRMCSPCHPGDSEHLLSNDSGDPPIVTADCAQLSSIIQKMGFVFGSFYFC